MRVCVCVCVCVCARVCVASLCRACVLMSLHMLLVASMYVVNRLQVREGRCCACVCVLFVDLFVSCSVDL